MYLYPNCKLLVVYIICNNVTHYLAFFPTFYLITPIPFYKSFWSIMREKKKSKTVTLLLEKSQSMKNKKQHFVPH